MFMLPVCFWVFVFHLGATFSNSQEKSSEVEGISQAFVAFAQERNQSTQQTSFAAHYSSAFGSSFKRFQFSTLYCKDNDYVRSVSVEVSLRAYQRQTGGVLSSMLCSLDHQAVGIQRNPVPNTAAKATRSPSQQQIGVIRTGKGVAQVPSRLVGGNNPVHGIDISPVERRRIVARGRPEIKAKLVESRQSSSQPLVPQCRRPTIRIHHG